MLMELDRRTAARIIHSLAESGQPPKSGALLLNVGTEALLQDLDGEYLVDLLPAYQGQDGAGVCKWIEANYGNGKTQFLRCFQEQAWSRDYVTSFVELSQDECPLDRPERIYGAVARGLQARPLTPADIDRGRGIDVMLQQLFDRMFDGVLTRDVSEDLRQQATMWLQDSLGSTPVESTGFRTAVQKHLLGKLQGDAESATIAANFLRGDQLPAAELKKIGVFEKLDKANGLRMLRSLCQLLQRTGLAVGTALLFDEARRSLSLMSNKAERVACENLLSVINRCNSGELPGTIFLYAVMPEFFTNFVTAYPALQQRCSASSRIDLESLRGIPEIELLQRIGRRITDIYGISTGQELTEGEFATQNLRSFAEHAVRQAMVSSGRRRLFVKAWTSALKQGDRLTTTLISADEVEAFTEGAKVELEGAEQNTVAAEGE